jgi:hypothetical protein
MVSGKASREFFRCGRLGRLHLQQIIEAIEIIEKTHGSHDLDNFSFRVEAPELGHFGIGIFQTVDGHDLCEMDSRLFCVIEQRA